MPSASKRKQIFDNLVSTIRTVSTAGGYNYNLDVERVKPVLVQIDQIAGGAMPFVSVTIIREDVIEAVSGYSRGTITFRVQGYTQSRDADLMNSDLEKLIWDVRKVVMIDRTRGSVACNTSVTSIETDEGLLSSYEVCMFEMIVSCWYDYPVLTP